MCLSQVLVLEAFWYFVDNGNEYEVNQNPKDHAAPVSRLRWWSAYTDDDNKEQSKEDEAPCQHVKLLNSTSIWFEESWAECDRVVKLALSHARLRKSWILKPLLWIHSHKFRPNWRIFDVDMVRVCILWNVVNLLRFLSHKTMSWGNVTQVEPRKVISGEQVFLGHLQMSLEMLNKSIIVYTLQVFVRIELIFEFSVIFKECLIDHELEVFSSEGPPCIYTVHIH